MNLEKIDFEQKGLKLDKDRVLTYSQLNCPLDCKYCFVEDMNFNQKKDVAYLSDEQLELIGKLPEEIKMIMLGCDTEFFQSRDGSLKILEKLSELNKDIAVITKLALSEDFIGKIREIDKELNKNGNFLSFSVSLTAIESSAEWEPKAPSPKRRLEVLKMAHEAGLKIMVALRPLLPTISKEELERVVEASKDYCYGYYSGPLYLKSLELMKNNEQYMLDIEKMQPHWMPEEHTFYKVEKRGQMDLLKQILIKYNKPLFEGAAEGMEYLKKI